MANVARSLWVAALSACLMAGACRKSEPDGATRALSGAPTPSAQTATVRLVVSRDETRLGVFELPPAKPGVLTLEVEGTSAAKLKEVADQINADDSVRVEMHLPSEKKGERGPYGEQIFRRGNANYAKGVEMKLISEGYRVQRVE